MNSDTNVHVLGDSENVGVDRFEALVVQQKQDTILTSFTQQRRFAESRHQNSYSFDSYHLVFCHLITLKKGTIPFILQCQSLWTLRHSFYRQTMPSSNFESLHSTKSGGGIRSNYRLNEYHHRQSNAINNRRRPMHRDLSRNGNGDGHHGDHQINHELNQLLQLEHEAQEDIDLESLLDDELESLSS